MLVELPRVAIESLVNQYEDIKLSQVDDIMFFRPTCQSVFISKTDTEPCPMQAPPLGVEGVDLSLIHI